MALRTPGVSVRRTEINGGPGAVFCDAHERVIAVWALDVADGQITCIGAIVNPDKLAPIGPVGDIGSVLGRDRKPPA